MTLGDLYRKSQPISFHELDMIVAAVLKRPKEFVYGNPTYRLSSKQLQTIHTLAKRRANDEPMAYLLGHKEFYGLDFLVDKRVLIPRPSTELLIELVINQYRDNKPTILDVGTGSGNIAITLKHLLPKSIVFASDVSAAALVVAKQNARRLKTKVQFYKSNVLKQLPKSLYGKLDLITFNAPYLTKQEASKANLKHEPQVALTPTGSPTSLIEQLLQQAAPFLKPNGQIYFEMGHRQANQIRKLSLKYFPQAKITVHQDLGGWDRVVVVKL